MFPRLLFCVAVMGGGDVFSEAGRRRLIFKTGDLMKEILTLGGVIGVASGLIYGIMLQITGAMNWKELLGTLRETRRQQEYREVRSRLT